MLGAAQHIFRSPAKIKQMSATYHILSRSFSDCTIKNWTHISMMHLSDNKEQPLAQLTVVMVSAEATISARPALMI